MPSLGLIVGSGVKPAASRRRNYSEIYLCYAGERRVRCREGSVCPRALARQAAALFDAAEKTLPVVNFARLETLLDAAHGAGHEMRFVAQVRDGERGGRSSIPRIRKAQPARRCRRC